MHLIEGREGTVSLTAKTGRASLSARLIALAVAAAVGLGLAGCTPTAEAPDGAVGGNKVQEIIDRGTITVGMMLTLPPMEQKDASGNPEGYNVDIAQLLAESLGVELEIVEMSAENRIANIQTGKVDVLFSAPAITLQRAQVVNFTDAYLAAGTALMTLADGGYTTFADLDGEKIGVLKGTIHDEVAAAAFPNSTTQLFDSPTDEMTALRNGQIAAFLMDGNSAVYAAAQDPTLAAIGGDFGPVEYDGMAVQKGDQDWLNYLNTFIFLLEADGTNQALFEKWFGAPRLNSPRLPSPIDLSLPGSE